jgi:glyoxylase-like metal-dependent hydrolase (beta-lactamase superfamily II)
MTIKCTIVPVTPYQQNCSIWVCTETNKAAVIDPGGDIDKIMKVIDEQGAELEKIFLTHGHLDHCSASDELRSRADVPIEGPQKEDLFWINQLEEHCKMSGFPPAKVFTPDRWLEQDDEVTFGNQTLHVSHCPGHTPGHVVFFNPQHKLAAVGDVLFQGSIGRTDFPRGDYDTLVNAIKTKLWPMGDDVTFIPGHGPNSTFGQERKTNAFVADEKFA